MRSFALSTKEIWNQILKWAYANNTRKYGISVPNKFLKLQIDNCGTGSIDFFLFIFMIGYFTKIKIYTFDINNFPWNVSSKNEPESSFWKFKYVWYLNMLIANRGSNGVFIPKMLRKYVGHDFTHLHKSSQKFSVVKQK